MADPNNLDELTKVGVSAGGGGLVVAVTTLIGKFLTAGKLEQVQAQNAALATQLAELNAKMTILVAASARRDADWERLDAERRFLVLEERQRTQDRVLEELRLLVKEISEGMVR
jgi:Tfp pilus assembly protein PilN